MTPHLDHAGLAEAGRQLSRVDAVLSYTGEPRRLEIGFGVPGGPRLTEPVPPLHVVHRSVTGMPGASMTTELLGEVRVDAGLGAGAVHAVRPGPGGAS